MKLLSTTALAAVFALGLGTVAQAGTVLDAIKARGELICGVNTNLTGFSAPDAQGNWTGLDVDYCKALAAAILGDASKVKYVPLTAQQRFTALQSGEIDVLSRNTTWTLTRDTSLGLDFVGVNFYDGQGFMVRKDLGVNTAKELDGATVCVQPGTTTELNLADYFTANGMSFQPVVIENLDEVNNAYFSGRCDVLTTDISGLASVRATSPQPDQHVILPDVASKEPLGPSVRHGDDEFRDIARWTLFALLEAEEKGVTQANVDELATSSKDPTVQRLLGTPGPDGKTAGMGALLKLDEEWARRAIKAVGNYGEIFERNAGPNSALGLPRGVNNLWNKGGLMYAPPIR